MSFRDLSAQASPFLWGAASGAIALAIVGFAWGGWVTGGTADKLAGARADAATLASLVPICVAQFQKSPEAKGRLAALRAVTSWEQGGYVMSGGWATMPGSAGEPNREVAAACADALTKVATEPAK
jgi:hypothetical protein